MFYLTWSKYNLFLFLQVAVVLNRFTKDNVSSKYTLKFKTTQYFTFIGTELIRHQKKNSFKARFPSQSMTNIYIRNKNIHTHYYNCIIASSNSSLDGGSIVLIHSSTNSTNIGSCIASWRSFRGLVALSREDNIARTCGLHKILFNCSLSPANI